MKKSTKIWLIAAASLVVIGALIFTEAMWASHWEFSRLSTDKFETNTYEIKEKFTDINIDTTTDDIIFRASDDGECRVVCYEDVNVKHTVTAENGTLNVSVSDGREWYEHIGIGFHAPRVTVYLPETEYGALTVSVSTGDITVSGVTFSGDIKAYVTTGEVKLENVTCKSFITDGATGDITLENVIAAEKFSVERSTGDVTFRGSDASEISVKTSTGDVSGTLLSEKVFVTDTSTGDVSVPETKSGGKCGIHTSTGDINIRIAE